MLLPLLNHDDKAKKISPPISNLKLVCQPKFCQKSELGKKLISQEVGYAISFYQDIISCRKVPFSFLHP